MARKRLPFAQLSCATCRLCFCFFGVRRLDAALPFPLLCRSHFRSLRKRGSVEAQGFSPAKNNRRAAPTPCAAFLCNLSPLLLHFWSAAARRRFALIAQPNFQFSAVGAAERSPARKRGGHKWRVSVFLLRRFLAQAVAFAFPFSPASAAKSKRTKTGHLPRKIQKHLRKPLPASGKPLSMGFFAKSTRTVICFPLCKVLA